MECSTDARDCSSESSMLPIDATSAVRASAMWCCVSADGSVGWMCCVCTEAATLPVPGGSWPPMKKGLLCWPGRRAPFCCAGGGEERDVVVEAGAGRLAVLAVLGWVGDGSVVVEVVVVDRVGPGGLVDGVTDDMVAARARAMGC